jgi:DNA-binding transcriptional MerR regulator/methylmalonyl-CoA mutase cobalamin-binding subunit
MSERLDVLPTRHFTWGSPRVNELTPAPLPALSIAAVERDTGLSKDTLRVWERRYGFPSPTRDAQGERVYPLQQVEKLRVVKRLLDAGHRPGAVVALTQEQLEHLGQSATEPLAAASDGELAAPERQACIDLIRAHDAPRLRSELTRHLTRMGVARFVTELAAPLNAAVGEAWLRGHLEIYEEHLYAETLQGVLRTAIGSVPEPVDPASPRVLLSTFPGEPHVLGLLMLEAVLAMEGCRCTSLGTQTPLWDIGLAAAACRSDVVALSFTACLNPNQIVEGLAELRRKLPAAVQIWAGGSAPVLHRRPLTGVQAFAGLAGMASAVASTRDRLRP